MENWVTLQDGGTAITQLDLSRGSDSGHRIGDGRDIGDQFHLH